MKRKRQVPRLMRSELLGRIYIVTKYDSIGENGEYLANEKFDVTEEFELMALKWLQSDENVKKKVIQNE